MSDLNDFLRVIAEAKAKDPKHQAIKEIKESVKADVDDFFTQLTGKKQIEVPIEKIEEIVEKIEIVEDLEKIEEVNIPKIKTEDEKQAEVLKLLKKRDTATPFQQPDPEPTTKDLKAITDKLKFMEQWLGKITAAGPGSGEVQFRYLDDVNRFTMESGNDSWVLEYDATTGKVQFTEDIGPVRTVRLNTEGPIIERVPGTLSWNAIEDCLDVTQADGSTCQVGFEHYFPVHNHSGADFSEGNVVKFAGVDLDYNIPMCDLMTSDFSTSPLYIIGVLTGDIPDGGYGRATVFGKVRNIDTTGAAVGENWQLGDLLWVHPSIPGKLTRNKPTTPEVAISVAAIVKRDVDGELLVRPTIWPRLHYGTFLNTVNHTIATANTPTSISLDTTQKAYGFTISSVNSSHIIAGESGLYNFSASYQMTSTNSSAKNVYFWLRLNGVDIPDTTRIVSVNGNGTNAVFSTTWSVSMDQNDYVQMMWAVNDTTIILNAPAATAFAPTAPSVLLTVTQSAI